MAIGLAHVKSRKVEKATPAEVVAAIPPSAPDKVSTKKMKSSRRGSASAADFEEPESTWMDWSANRVTAAPASVAMATIQRLCALENQLLGWAESQITTRLHTQK